MADNKKEHKPCPHFNKLPCIKADWCKKHNLPSCAIIETIETYTNPEHGAV